MDFSSSSSATDATSNCDIFDCINEFNSSGANFLTVLPDFFDTVFWNLAEGEDVVVFDIFEPPWVFTTFFDWVVEEDDADVDVDADDDAEVDVEVDEGDLEDDDDDDCDEEHDEAFFDSFEEPPHETHNEFELILLVVDDDGDGDDDDKSVFWDTEGEWLSVKDFISDKGEISPSEVDAAVTRPPTPFFRIFNDSTEAVEVFASENELFWAGFCVNGRVSGPFPVVVTGAGAGITNITRWE